MYYLEYNHYKGRKAELEFLQGLTDREDPLQQDRPAFLPQPELRDTVPNIGLYSVLYKLPPHHFTRLSSATSSQVGRQLSSAVEFFDRVVPNQPGYSSSVAAVTILPDVNQVSRAWKKWFACASKLRRLRFIRKRLRKLGEGQEQEIQIVFEGGSTSPDKAQSMHDSRLCAEPNDGIGKVEESDIVAEPSMIHYPEQSQSSTVISNSSGTNKPQEGNGASASSSSNVGSSKETIIKVAPPPRSSTPRVVLATVDEGSSSDSSSEFSYSEGQRNELKSKSRGPSDTTISTTHSRERDQMNDTGSVKPTISGDSSEYSHDFEGPRDVTYQLDQTRLSPSPKSTSNASYASNASFDNIIGRNFGAGLGNSAQKDHFLSSVGIQEESKLDHFLSDDEIEQLTVYCREFARRYVANTLLVMRSAGFVDI